MNRTFRDEPSGLVVDYIDIAKSLQAALADYTDRARQEVGAPTAEALDLLQEKHEVVSELLDRCPRGEASLTQPANHQFSSLVMSFWRGGTVAELGM